MFDMILTLSWRWSLLYRNQSICTQTKSMDWFLYDNVLRHERVKYSSVTINISNTMTRFSAKLIHELKFKILERTISNNKFPYIKTSKSLFDHQIRDCTHRKQFTGILRNKCCRNFESFFQGNSWELIYFE